MKLPELLRKGENCLREAGIPEWKTDAWLLLEYAVGCTRNEYLLDPDRQADADQTQNYEELLRRRSAHVPLQYLTGAQEFMGLSFRVNENVLIPRQDTETLAERALAWAEPGMRILDLCTGSGCILLSVLALSREKGIVGVGADLSRAALEVAEENRTALGLEDTAVFVQSDLFTGVTGRFDLILSNPPYIPAGVLETLQEEVRDYEPRMALDGHADGLYFYREIIRQAPEYLEPGGGLLLEIGCEQAEAVCGFLEADFTEICVIPDLAGLDRVVSGRLRA